MQRSYKSKIQSTFILEPPDSPCKEFFFGFSWARCCHIPPHLHQDSEEMLVLRGASTRARVLPIKIQPIKSILAQELDDWRNESLAVLWSGNHGSETDRDSQKAEWGLGGHNILLESQTPIFLPQSFSLGPKAQIKVYCWFSLVLLYITTLPAMVPQRSLYFVIHPTLIILPNWTCCFECLSTLAQCVVSLNGLWSSYAFKRVSLFIFMTFSFFLPEGKWRKVL